MLLQPRQEQGDQKIGLMKFSIIVPLYNKAPFICNTIASALGQACADFELIVVDDGSTDGGAELVAAITDPRVILLHQSNAGVSAARNKGIAHAQGEWISFLDADDWHHPEHLATLLVAAQHCPHADVLATKFLPLPHTESKWPRQWLLPQHAPEIELIQDLPRRWVKGPTLITSSTAVRRTRLQSMNSCFPLGESGGEDLDLWFRLAEQTSIAFVHLPLVAYRTKVPGSLSSSHPLSIPPYIHRMRQRAHAGALTKHQRQSALWFVSQVEVGVARGFFSLGQRIEGFRWLARGRHAMQTRRWWITLAMGLLVPSKMVHHWEQWRVRRTTLAGVGETFDLA